MPIDSTATVLGILIAGLLEAERPSSSAVGGGEAGQRPKSEFSRPSSGVRRRGWARLPRRHRIRSL